jgi:hypothetical protein
MQIFYLPGRRGPERRFNQFMHSYYLYYSELHISGITDIASLQNVSFLNYFPSFKNIE